MRKLESKTDKLSVTYILSLLAIAVVAVVINGFKAALLIIVMSAAAFVADFVCVKLKKRNYEISDLSCIAESWLLAFMFPSTMPLEKALAAAVAAVLLGRHIFGENRTRLMPSPVIGYVFALCAWKDDVLSFPNITGDTEAMELSNGLIPSSSAHFNSAGVFRESLFDVFTGNINGAMGTNVIILLLICAVILLISRRIRFAPLIGVFVSMAFFGGVVHKSGEFLLSAESEVLANMVLFAAIFFASDKDTAPSGFVSGMLYGLTLGMVAYYISFFTDQENTIIPAIVICSPICLLCRSFVKKTQDSKADRKTEEALQQ